MAFVDRCIFLPTAGTTADFTVSSAITGYLTPAQAGAVNASVYSYAAEVRVAGAITEWEVGQGAYTVSGTVLARTTVLFSSNSNAKVNFSTAPNVMLTVLKEDLTALSGITVSTADSIVASTPASTVEAYASDIGQFFVWDGSRWLIDSSYFTVQPDAHDLGYIPYSNHIGYGTDYITEKLLANCTIGYGSGAAAEGQLRLTPLTGPVELYFGGVWNTIVTLAGGLRQVSAEKYALEGIPIGHQLKIFSGDSELLGLNGLPIVQGYWVSMGAYPVQQIISGGTF